jgi:predicted acetyltransferase
MIERAGGVLDGAPVHEGVQRLRYWIPTRR